MSKTVFITGGSRGIGAGVARRFAAAGYNAAVGYCASKGRAEALCAELNKLGARAMPVYADVTNLAGLERAAAAVEKNLGAVDVLVAAAGIAHYGLITDITEEEFDEVIAVNLKGVFLASRAVAPYMVGRKSGSIVTVALIYNNTLNIIDKNKREIGIFRAMGAGKFEILSIFLIEIIFNYFIISALSFPGIHLIIVMINDNIKYGDFSINIINLDIVKIIVILTYILFILFISVFLPLIKLLRKTPVEIIRINK